MKRDPVLLDWTQRRRALDEIVASLMRRTQLALEVCSVDRIHLHALVRVPDHDPKRWIGVAKKESSHYCKQSGQASVGGMWATGTKCLPVRSKQHFQRVRDYVLDHVQQGAVVWALPATPDMESFD